MQQDQIVQNSRRNAYFHYTIHNGRAFVLYCIIIIIQSAVSYILTYSTFKERQTDRQIDRQRQRQRQTDRDRETERRDRDRQTER